MLSFQRGFEKIRSIMHLTIATPRVQVPYYQVLFACEQFQELEQRLAVNYERIISYALAPILRKIYRCQIYKKGRHVPHRIF